MRGREPAAVGDMHTGVQAGGGPSTQAGKSPGVQTGKGPGMKRYRNPSTSKDEKHPAAGRNPANMAAVRSTRATPWDVTAKASRNRANAAPNRADAPGRGQADATGWSRLTRQVG